MNTFDKISCEEIFENDPQARAEFEQVCREWDEEAIAAQEAEGTRCYFDLTK